MQQPKQDLKHKCDFGTAIASHLISRWCFAATHFLNRQLASFAKDKQDHIRNPAAYLQLVSLKAKHTGLSVFFHKCKWSSILCCSPRWAMGPFSSCFPALCGLLQVVYE